MQKKKFLTEIFDIFEHLLSQNPANQDSQLSWFFQTRWKTVSKFKNMGFRELFQPESDFKTYSTESKCGFAKENMENYKEMVKKLN